MKKDEYKEFTLNYLNALARTALLARISYKAFIDFPKNLPKELKKDIDSDFKFLKERKQLRRKGFLTLDDYEHFTKDYDFFTKFGILLMFTNQFSLDAILKINKSKKVSQVLDSMLVKDAYRIAFLEKHNVPHRHLTVKTFNEKHGSPNVLNINTATPEDAMDYFTDVIDYNNQLKSQTLTTCLAHFESFLVESIRFFIQNTKHHKISKKKINGQTIRFISSYKDNNENTLKVRIPNLHKPRFWALVKFVKSQQISLLPIMTKETKDFLILSWHIRNIVIHNGGYINKKFINQHKEYSSQFGQLLRLDNDFVGNLFTFIWRSSLKIYANLVDPTT